MCESIKRLERSVNKKGVLIKVSGGALTDARNRTFSEVRARHIVDEICKVYDYPLHRIVVVVGGGNIWRGADGKKFGIHGAKSDKIGIYATMLNAIFLADKLQQRLGDDNVKLLLSKTADANERYSDEVAMKYLDNDKIVVVGGGIGIRRCSSDYAAVNIASCLELGAVMMAKDGTDGVYDRMPDEEGARRYRKLSYSDFVAKRLKVADNQAIILAEENGIPLVFYDFGLEDSLTSILREKDIGTLVSNCETEFYDE